MAIPSFTAIGARCISPKTARPPCPARARITSPFATRAGEIIRARCLAAGESATECESRAAQARAHAAAAGVAAHRVVSGLKSAELLDSGQCRDCREPSFNYRPGGSAQFILSVGNFDGEEPRHFRMGFMASSDNHYARPGTGYKEMHRRGFTESQAGDADAPRAVCASRRRPRAALPRPQFRSARFRHFRNRAAGILPHHRRLDCRALPRPRPGRPFGTPCSAAKFMAPAARAFCCGSIC